MENLTEEELRENQYTSDDKTPVKMCLLQANLGLGGMIWVNYHDLTQPHPNAVLSYMREHPRAVLSCIQSK